MNCALAAFLLAAGAARGFHLQPHEIQDSDAEAQLAPAEGREGEESPRFSLLLGTHHKTGTILAANSRVEIMRAIDHRSSVSINFHWGRIWCQTCAHPGPPAPMDGFPDGYRVAHFVRNPVSAVISGYLYHRDVSGAINNEDYGAGLAITYVREPQLMLHIKADESYSSFLRHVSVRVGLQAELDRFFRQEYDEWAASFAQCSSHRRTCRHVCLEEFAHDYNATWKKVMGFAGYNLDRYPELMDELSEHDVRLHTSQRPGIQTHLTSGRLTAKERLKMVAEIDDIDKTVYGGKLAALPSELHACGSPEGDERRSLVEVEDILDAWA